MHRVTNQELRAWIDQEMEVEVFPVACGKFIGLVDVDPGETTKPGLALVPPGIRRQKDMFVARLWGGSMEPKIIDGTWGIFHRKLATNPEGRIVLVEEQKTDGERYALKKFHRRADGNVELRSLNRRHPPVLLGKDGQYQIRGCLVGTVLEIRRIERPRFHGAEEVWAD